MFRNLQFSMILMIGLLGGCSSGSQDEARSGNQADGQVDLAAGELSVGGRIGNLAPEFQLERLDGGQLALSSLRGKVVLIDFWDTWCPPCRRAMPHLQELSEQYSDELVVVGIAFGKNGPDAVRSFVREHNLTFEFVLADPEMTIARDFGGISSLPTTYIIDASGVITHRWLGAKSKETYEQGIRQNIQL